MFPKVTGGAKTQIPYLLLAEEKTHKHIFFFPFAKVKIILSASIFANPEKMHYPSLPFKIFFHVLANDTGEILMSTLILAPDHLPS